MCSFELLPGKLSVLPLLSLLHQSFSVRQTPMDFPLVVAILILSWLILLPRLHVDGPVVVSIPFFLPFRGRFHEAEVDGHGVLVGGGDAGAAVAEAEAPQPLGQAVGEGSPAALADDWFVGAMHAEGVAPQVLLAGEPLAAGLAGVRPLPGV